LREIEATLRSLLRRLPETAKTPMPQAGAPGNGWQLLRSEWTLIAPTGNRVALTATEVTFLEAVLAKAGTAVTRAELIDALKRP
ncbi:hypothetical protein ABLW54_23955, partial [Salmonella enterica]|uniref:hypothetical protein n=1 Tax=Salmonella enterica TaxID=28901 RepID=UPI0032B3868E